LDVGFHLPAEHYQYAFEAWKKMRSTEDFNPDQYQEYPQDGRSHIRSSLLLDFYNLLNHDMAGFDDQTGEVMGFIKRKANEEASTQELAELDALAELLSQDPTKEELIAFYQESTALRLEAAEKDPYSLVFDI
jgi:nicotinic acid phosphoribosyltransferase